MPKGKIQSVYKNQARDKIRLKFRYGGKVYSKNVGDWGSNEDQALADMLMKQIEIDRSIGKVDADPKIYWSGLYARINGIEETKQSVSSYDYEKVEADSLSVWRAYTKYKSHSLRTVTLGKDFKAVERKLEQYGRNIYSRDDVSDFVVSTMGKLSDKTRRKHLVNLNAAWEYGVKFGMVSSNPFDGVYKIYRPRPVQKEVPFSKEELRSILEASQRIINGKYYWPLVKFRMLTGCRPSEAWGLQWKAIQMHNETIWFGESVVEGERNASKTGKAREFRIGSELRELLKEIRPKGCKVNDLVFPSPTGKIIDGHNFTNRTWKSILRDAGVEYRTFENLRHTFCSHMLEMGAKPLDICSMTGHSPETFFKHYASVIYSDELPRLL